MKKAIVCALIISLAGCGGNLKGDEARKAGAEKRAYLGKYQWNLLQMKGKGVENSGVNLKFDPVKGNMSGFNGCNYFFGTFTAEEDKIICNIKGVTKRACPGKESSMERDFLLAIQQKGLTFDLSEQTMNIYKEGDLLMIFGISEKK